MNRLCESTSPYLLQHADNPVNWYPWGNEALKAAKAQDKVIFLSIGYAACHWCHVMARESFEDPGTAALMNAHFVNIKVDREERPDLDSIYMSATVAMTGSGGWPMSVFLTPDLQPFFCGTYFPPERRFNLPSFKEILAAVASAWEKNREAILAAGRNAVEHIRPIDLVPHRARALSPGILKTAEGKLLDGYDWEFGGWGRAPKFPQPMAIEFLLRREGKGTEAALHALSRMARGGMYDVVGGGFARYSTDHSWLVPHFEKMLYDNAQLAMVYLHAWQATGDPEWRRVVEETLRFVTRELTNSEGGFCSSLDADSEHQEGKYYVWSYDEIQSNLGGEFDLFRAAYGLTEPGNWGGKIVLQRVMDDADLGAMFAGSYDASDPRNVPGERISRCLALLLEARQERIRPRTDDKVLTSWNALMLSAFAGAARAFRGTTQSEEYRNISKRNAAFLLSELRPDGRLRRAWRAGRTTGGVFLEDYGALILALLDLYQTDFDNIWFVQATELTEQMISLFNDPAGGFFDAPEGGEQLVFRPKDLQDHASPSGNSLACEALLRLAALSGRDDLRNKAEGILEKIAPQAATAPLGFSRWLTDLDFAVAEKSLIAILGEPSSVEAQDLFSEIEEGYHPHRMVAASSLPVPRGAPSLLHDRPAWEGKATAYVCRGFVCDTPVTDRVSLRQQLGKGRARLR